MAVFLKINLSYLLPVEGVIRIEGLQREQMVEAQEMFKTSNKVTRPEEALILGFKAGSRNNQCPGQGELVNIRLSENMDSVEQPDGIFKPMVVDTYFQMNYSTGE